MPLTYSDTRAKLAIRLKQIHIVAPDKILSETNDGHRQTLFSVMIGRLFRYISGQLGYFNLFGEISLEATVKHFSLTRFESIGNGRYRTDIIGHTEEDQLLVNKVGYG